MRIAFVLFLLTVSTLSLSACNTFEGFGKDLETAGQSIQGL